MSLPGDLSKEEIIERMIRVDHAGEYGAKRIYEGQLSVLKDTDKGPLIQHMAEQEEEHLKAFEELVAERNVRPSLLHPFWHLSGYVLGFVTAKLGSRAAMACTVAIEDVIADHYQEQLDMLENFPEEKDLRKKIKKFRDEELEHHDTGLEHEAELTPGYHLLSNAIKLGAKAAIFVAKRF